MTAYEVTGYTAKGMYSEVVKAHSDKEALAKAKGLIAALIPPTAKIKRWAVRAA
jgi:hypothetical protein